MSCNRNVANQRAVGGMGGAVHPVGVVPGRVRGHRRDQRRNAAMNAGLLNAPSTACAIVCCTCCFISPELAKTPTSRPMTHPVIVSAAASS